MLPYASPSYNEPSDRVPPPRTPRKHLRVNADSARELSRSEQTGEAFTAPLTGSTCFRDAFCRRYAIPPERFDLEMLRRCLSRRARLLSTVLTPFAPHLFSVDRMFIETIGRARGADELKAELKAFRDHSANRRWSRRWLKLRLSVWRVLDIADEVLPHVRAGDWQPSKQSNAPWN